MLLTHATFRRLCDARELLTEYSEDPAGVRNVAKQVAISPFHFIRQFEALFGMTPHQYRMQARIERAKMLLAQGEHSVTEVCMEIGFSSLGTFSGLFRRRVGESPRAYQRKARSLVQVPHSYPQILFPGCLILMGYLPASAFRNFQEAVPSADR